MIYCTIGVSVHMCVVSARCPYLAGHVAAALKNDHDRPAAAHEDGVDDVGGDGKLARVELWLEHATADTLSLLARYLYTDEVPADAAGETLGTLGGLARELLLPRY